MRVLGVLFVLVLWKGSAHAEIRGVRPDLEKVYVKALAEGTWRCLDGSRTLSASVINDDWCHCADGSDEPGTSACANGFFYCANHGYERRYLSSAFVDDGICDCCDGSDEAQGCENACLERNLHAQEELRRQIGEVQAALDTRKQYAASAIGKVDEMRAKLAGIDGEIAAAEKEVERLAEEKKRLEETADDREAARTARREAREAEAAAREERREEEEAAAAAAGTDALAANDEAAVPGEGGGAAKGAADSKAGPEETVEERGRRIAAQWTHDPDAAGAGGAAAASETSTGDASDDGTQQTAQETAPDDDTDTELQTAETAHQEAEEKLEDLKTEKEQLQRQVTFDYAPDGAWLELVGACLTAEAPQFNYEICLFDKAQQVDNNGGHRTNLGKWRGFEARYMEAVFDGGDTCGNGLKRSLRVKFECGQSQRAWGPSEPAPCSYAASVSTPAACKKRDLKVLQERLAALAAAREELAADAEAEAAPQQPQRDEL